MNWLLIFIIAFALVLHSVILYFIGGAKRDFTMTFYLLGGGTCRQCFFFWNVLGVLP